MNKKLLALAVAGAMVAPLSAQAVEMSSYGQVGVKLEMPDNDATDDDWRIRATKARLGFRATEETSVGKFIGEIEFDIDNIANDSDMGANGDADGDGIIDAGEDYDTAGDFDIRRARVILATKSAGTFVFAARSPSGQYSDLYGNLDIFSVGANMGEFGQGEFTRHVAAWKTPTTADIYAVVAFLSLPGNDGAFTTDGDDIDVSALRVIWNSGPFHAGAGFVDFATSNVTRTAINFGYKANGMAVGATYEDQDNAAGDTVLGLVGSFAAGNNTFKVGYTQNSSDVAADDGDSVVELEVAHSFSKAVTGFVNHWTRSDETANSDTSTTSIGVNMNF